MSVCIDVMPLSANQELIGTRDFFHNVHTLGKLLFNATLPEKMFHQ